MNICYLSNQYPKVSHTFIRREIAALESKGANILRVSARISANELVDPLDIEEAKKTVSMAQGEIPAVIWAAVKQFFGSPIITIRATLKALELGKQDHLQPLKYLIYLAEACYLKNLCKAHKIDHIHAHFGTNPAAVAMLCRLIGGPKYSFTVHGPEEFDRPLSLSLSEKIRHAHSVVAISYFCKSQLYRWCSSLSDWKKIHVIRCALDSESFKNSQPITPNNRNLLAVGRLSEQKGFPTLIEAIIELHKREVDFHVDIIGDGPMRQELDSLITENGIEEKVSILGYMSGQDIQNKLDQSCALLVPSFAEGLPVVIMESFARARPVLTTQIAAMSELVEDNVSGWIIPPGDPHQLAKAIERILTSDTHTLNNMGLQGQKKTYEQHNSKTEATKLQQLFNSKKP